MFGIKPQRAVVAGLAILILTTLLAGWWLTPLVKVERKKRLVNAGDEPVMLLWNGASDAVIKKSVDSSNRHVDQISGLGDALLFHVVAERRHSLVKWLLEEKDANPNGTPGSSPLAQAIREGDVKMVRILLEHGADPRHDPGHGITPMWLARHSAENDRILTILKAWESP